MSTHRHRGDPVLTSFPGQILQAGEQRRRRLAAAVVQRQSVRGHRTHVHAAHARGMLGDVVCCSTLAVVMELGQRQRVGGGGSSCSSSSYSSSSYSSSSYSSSYRPYP